MGIDNTLFFPSNHPSLLQHINVLKPEDQNGLCLLTATVEVHQEIALEDVVLGDRLGNGTASDVLNGEWNGIEVAIKKIKDLDPDLSLRRELSMMRYAAHCLLFLHAH